MHPLFVQVNGIVDRAKRLEYKVSLKAKFGLAVEYSIRYFYFSLLLVHFASIKDKSLSCLATKDKHLIVIERDSSYGE